MSPGCHRANAGTCIAGLEVARPGVLYQVTSTMPGPNIVQMSLACAVVRHSCRPVAMARAASVKSGNCPESATTASRPLAGSRCQRSAEPSSSRSFRYQNRARRPPDGRRAVPLSNRDVPSDIEAERDHRGRDHPEDLAGSGVQVPVGVLDAVSWCPAPNRQRRVGPVGGCTRSRRAEARG